MAMEAISLVYLVVVGTTHLGARLAESIDPHDTEGRGYVVGGLLVLILLVIRLAFTYRQMGLVERLAPNPYLTRTQWLRNRLIRIVVTVLLAAELLPLAASQRGQPGQV